MPRRKLIRPAEPLTPPEPGSLEENIWLGDQVAVHANPVAQLRWYDRRGELLIAIQNRDKNAERIAELEKKVKELETQPPAVPPVPSTPTSATDSETSRRVNKMMTDLEEERRLKKLKPTPEQEVEPEPPAPPLYVRDLAGNLRLNVNRTEPKPESKSEPMEQKPSTEELKKAAADLEKEAADDTKAARIAELNQAREEILKGRCGRAFMLTAVSNPTFLRDGNLALKSIARELDVLEGRSPAKSLNQRPHFDPEAADRRRAANEEQDFTNRLLEGERITAANRANARPAPISGSSFGDDSPWLGWGN